MSNMTKTERKIYVYPLGKDDSDFKIYVPGLTKLHLVKENEEYFFLLNNEKVKTIQILNHKLKIGSVRNHTNKNLSQIEIIDDTEIELE